MCWQGGLDYDGCMGNPCWDACCLTCWAAKGAATPSVATLATIRGLFVQAYVVAVFMPSRAVRTPSVGLGAARTVILTPSKGAGAPLGAWKLQALRPHSSGRQYTSSLHLITKEGRLRSPMVAPTLGLLVEQGEVVLSTANLLHSGPFAFRLNPASSTIAGTAALQNKVLLATEERRPAGAAWHDVDDSFALAAPINASGSATAHAAARRTPQPPEGAAAPARDTPAAGAATLGALYLGFSQQEHIDAAHTRGLLLVALQLAPLLSASSSKCLYWADVVLGNLHPEERGPATPRRAAFTSWSTDADLRQGSATTSGELELEPSSDEESWEETDEEEGEQQGQLAATPEWGAGACGDDRQGGPPDDPSGGAAALLALGGVAAEPAAAAGKLAGSGLPPEPHSRAAERVEALPGPSISSPRQALPQHPAVGRLKSWEEGDASASSSSTSSSWGGRPEAGPSVAGLKKASKGSEEGELGEPSSPDSDGKPGKCVLLPAVAQPATLRQAGMSRLTLRFADPLTESAFRAWHYACLAKLDAMALAFMMLIHLVLCAANPDCRSRVMHPHWPLGLVPALPLALLLLSPQRYIRWRDAVLVALNAYISTWQLLAAWPPPGRGPTVPPVAASPGYHPASRLPWLAMEALYMDGFMWLLVVAMACQMRFSVHAPVQLLNFVAAGLLFHSACLAKLGLAGQDLSAAAGAPLGVTWAAGREAGQGHQVFSCMVVLAAKVFLLAVAVPLLALRRVELGARTIFLSHQARLAQQTAVQEL